MAIFPPCPDCLAEYGNPADRRFHAQNIACPRVAHGSGSKTPARPEGAIDRNGNDQRVLAQAGEWLRSGKIVAVKGIGGFHLLCDATSSDVVRLLRQRKRREGKPLAVLFADRRQLERHVHDRRRRMGRAIGCGRPDRRRSIVGRRAH